jgi:hypothetical protein
MKSSIFLNITPYSWLKAKRRLSKSQALLATFFTLISCLACSSTLKVEAIYFSETSLDFRRITRRYIPEDRTPPLNCKCNALTCPIGRAVAQRLDAGFLPRRPRFAYGQHVGFVVDKAELGQVFSKYFGLPCQSFHRFLHYHNHPGLTQ